MLTTAVLVLPLLVFLLVTPFLRLPLQQRHGLFALAAMTLVALCYLMVTPMPLWPLLGALLAAEVVHLAFVALFGTRVYSMEYAALLGGVGLYPWFWNRGMSIFYAALALVAVLIWLFAERPYLQGDLQRKSSRVQLWMLLIMAALLSLLGAFLPL